MITSYEKDSSAILSTAYSRMAVELAKKKFDPMDIHFLSEQFANYIFKVGTLDNIDEKIIEFISNPKFITLNNLSSNLDTTTTVSTSPLTSEDITQWKSFIDSLQDFSIECMRKCKDNIPLFEKVCVDRLQTIYEIPVFLRSNESNFGELMGTLSNKSNLFPSVVADLLKNLTDYFIYCYIMMPSLENENARYAIDIICDIIGLYNYMYERYINKKKYDIIYSDLLVEKTVLETEKEILVKIDYVANSVDFYKNILEIKNLEFNLKINEISLSYLSPDGSGYDAFQSLLIYYTTKYEYDKRSELDISDGRLSEHKNRFSDITSGISGNKRLYFYLRSKYSKDISDKLFDFINKSSKKDFIDKLSDAIRSLSRNPKAFDIAKESRVIAIFSRSIPNIGENTDMVRKLIEGNYAINESFIEIAGEYNNIYFPDKNASKYFSMLAANRLLGIKDKSFVDKLTKDNVRAIKSSGLRYGKDILEIMNMVSPYEVRVFLEKLDPKDPDLSKYSTLTKFASTVGLINVESYFNNLLAKLYYKFSDFEILADSVEKIARFYGEVWQEENRSSLKFLGSNYNPIYVPDEDLEKIYKAVSGHKSSDLTAEDSSILEKSLKYYEKSRLDPSDLFTRFNRHEIHPMIYYYHKIVQNGLDLHIVLIDSAENTPEYIFKYMGGNVISLVTPFVKGNSSLPGIEFMDLASKGLYDILAKEVSVIKDLKKLTGEDFKKLLLNTEGYSSILEKAIEDIVVDLKKSSAP
jgi:hypothetical protein